MEAELQALGYKHAWQLKRWSVWRDSRYVTDSSPNLHNEHQPAEELSAPSPGSGSHYPGAAILGDLLAAPEIPRPSSAVGCT